MKQFFLIFFSLLVFCGTQGQAVIQQTANDDNQYANYPVPPANKKMLFYLQRTHNTNTVVYDVNYNADSSINVNEPVKVYWIRYADDGSIQPLSMLQRTFAYGVSSTIIDKDKKWFKIHLMAYDKRDIFIMNTAKDKNYRAFIKINGTLSVMNKIFFKTDGGTFWNPNVVYVELTGKDVHTNKTVIERFKPIR